MKKIVVCLLLIAGLKQKEAFAQDKAWTRNSKVLSIGAGISQFYHQDIYYYNNDQLNLNQHNYQVTTEQLNFQGEFGIHKYVGLGFFVGVGGRGPLYNSYRGELTIPGGISSNFHFYQLIADNTRKNIHADKLDIYAGLNIGSGLAIAYYRDETDVVPLAFGGLHAGIRYYATPKFGLNAEVGMGKSIINAGFIFKL